MIVSTKFSSTGFCKLAGLLPAPACVPLAPEPTLSASNICKFLKQFPNLPGVICSMLLIYKNEYLSAAHANPISAGITTFGPPK